MKTKHLIFLLIALPLFAINTQAQVWIGTLPAYYNPSFAGSTDKIRISSYNSYYKSTKWNNQNSYLGHQALSGDLFVSAISTGIGLNLSYFHSRDYSAYRRVYKYPGNSLEAELIVAPKISINGKYTLSPSVSLSYLNNSYRNSDIVFFRRDHEYYQSNTRIHSRLGFMMQNQNFYLGYSTEYEPQYKTYWSSQKAYFESRRQMARYPQRYLFNYSSVQAGYNININKEKKISLTPQANWIFPHDILKAYQFIPDVANLSFRVNKLLAGVGYKSGDLTFMIGFQSEKFRLMLMKDNSPNRHKELFNDYHLSLRYLIGKKNDNLLSF